MPATCKPDGRPEVRPPPSGPIHHITSQVEKWRFKCPNQPHHDDWRVWNAVFCCQTCQQLRAGGEEDVEPVFNRLWDAKEKVYVPRECFRIEIGSVG